MIKSWQSALRIVQDDLNMLSSVKWDDDSPYFDSILTASDDFLCLAYDELGKKDYEFNALISRAEINESTDRNSNINDVKRIRNYVLNNCEYEAKRENA